MVKYSHTYKQTYRQTRKKWRGKCRTFRGSRGAIERGCISLRRASSDVFVTRIIDPPLRRREYHILSVIDRINPLDKSALACLIDILWLVQKLVVRVRRIRQSHSEESDSPCQRCPLCLKPIPLNSCFPFNSSSPLKPECQEFLEIFSLPYSIQEYTKSSGIKKNLVNFQPGTRTYDKS